MATWVQALLGIAASVTALSVIGSQILRPMWRASHRLDQMVPMLAELTDQLGDVRDVGAILREIVGQVRSDSGSSLLDIIKRLEAAAVNNAASNTALLGLLTSLGVRIDAGAATALRNEAGAAVVATNLSAAQTRADEAEAVPGEAGDAAARSAE